MSLRAYARTHRFASGLTLIAIAGFLLRVIYVVAFRHHVVGGDGYRYHFGAIILADAKAFVNPLVRSGIPDTGHPPAWTILLAGATKLGLRTWLEHQIATSIVGTATIVMVGVAARTAFGSRVALIAAALAAVYPNIFLYEREVLSEPLAMLGVATAIWLAYKFLAAPSASLAIALGSVVGVLTMTKSDQIAIAVVLVAPLILAQRNIDFRRRVAWLAMAAAVCVAIMAPWSIYLSARFDRPVLLTGSIGAAMGAGNCAQTYKGELLAYYALTCAIRLRPSSDPITGDEQTRRRALEFMRDNKGRVPVVMAARVGRTFGFFRPFQQMRLETERGTSEWVIRVGFWAYWALLLPAFAGVVSARRREIPTWPLLVFPLVVVLSVLLTIGAVRYRAPAEIPLVILSAVGLDAAAGAWWQRGAPRYSPTAVAPESPTGAGGL